LDADNFAVAHATIVIQQLMDVKIHLHGVVAVVRLSVAVFVELFELGICFLCYVFVQIALHHIHDVGQYFAVHIVFFVPVAHCYQVFFAVFIGETLAVLHQYPTLLRKSHHRAFALVVQKLHPLTSFKLLHDAKIKAFGKGSSKRTIIPTRIF
jgi:hypothetical protein